MSQVKYWMGIFLINITAIAAVIFDRWLKVWSQDKMPDLMYEWSSFKFHLLLSYNSNIAFGISVPTFLFYILICFILLVLIVMLKQSYKLRELIHEFAITWIVLGSLSNLTDRILYGAVVDYIGVEINTFAWPIFNIADSMIVIGVLVWVIHDMFFQGKNKEKL